MSKEPPQVFLDRRAYRRRRLTDAARILPVFGAILLCLPMLWVLSDGAGARTTYVMSFLFIAWPVLIILAALISSHMPEAADDDDVSGDV